MNDKELLTKIPKGYTLVHFYGKSYRASCAKSDNSPITTRSVADIEKIVSLEDENERLKRENESLSKDLIETQNQASEVRNKLEDVELFFCDEDGSPLIEPFNSKGLENWFKLNVKPKAVDWALSQLNKTQSHWDTAPEGAVKLVRAYGIKYYLNALGDYWNTEKRLWIKDKSTEDNTLIEERPLTKRGEV